MVSLGILLSYPLQFFIAVQIMFAAIEEKRGPLRYPLATNLLFRVFLVLLTCKCHRTQRHPILRATKEHDFRFIIYSYRLRNGPEAELFPFADRCHVLIRISVNLPASYRIGVRLGHNPRSQCHNVIEKLYNYDRCPIRHGHWYL